MLQKFVITVAIILIIWYGFKWLDRRRTIKKTSDDNDKLGSKKNSKGDAVKEMIKCSKCGAYFPDDSEHDCS